MTINLKSQNMKQQFSNNKFVTTISPGITAIKKITFQRNIAIWTGVTAILVAGLIVYKYIKVNADLSNSVEVLKNRNDFVESSLSDSQKVANAPTIVANNLANPIIQPEETILE